MFIDNPRREIFVEGYPKPVNGAIQVPSGPGLGLELDWDLVDRYTVGNSYPITNARRPHSRRSF